MLSALLVAVALAEPVTVEADRLQLAADGVDAGGEVVLTLPEGRLTAEQVAWTAGDGRVEAREGRFEGPLGQIAFERATLTEGFAELWHADLRLEERSLSAGHLRVAGTTWEAEDLRLDPCGCGRPVPWAVEARSGRRVGDTLTLEGARLRVLGLALPRMRRLVLPLARRSGFLLPTLGFGRDGPRVGAPLYLTMGPSADLTLTPEVRALRGPRLLTETRWASRGGRGTVDAFLGWDFRSDRARAGGRMDAVWEQGRLRAAADGQLTSDEQVPVDYGDRFTARHLPWLESRALVGLGDAELGLDALQWTDGRFPLATLSMARGSTPIGKGVLASGALQGTAWAGPGGLVPVTTAEASLSRPVHLGPLALEPGLRGRFGADDEGAALAGGAWLATTLPLWRRDARGVHRLEPGLDAWYTPTLSDRGLWTPWAVSPRLRYRRVGDADVAVELAAPFTRDGLSAAWNLRVGSPHLGLGLLGRSAPHTAWADGEVVDLALLLATASAGPWSATLRWGYDAETDQPAALLHQVSADTGSALPGRASTITLGAGATVDLRGPGLQEARALFGWRHPSGCVGFRLDGRWARDRVLPDVALALDVRPPRSP